MRTIQEGLKNFAATLSDIFGKDWAKAEDQVSAASGFLVHIPDEAWLPMTQIAADRWESWPKNFVRAVKDTYLEWGRQEKVERTLDDCPYCNQVGFFSGTKQVEIKPRVFMTYTYTWRCAGCRNWFGVLGKMVPIAYPLEVKSRGFEVLLYPAPMRGDAKRFALTELLEGIGERVNPKKDRPAVQHDEAYR